MSQLHKRFTSDQVKELLGRYPKYEMERKYIQEILGIKKSRFFMLLKQYKQNPQHFAIQYQRTTPSCLSPRPRAQYPERIIYRKEDHSE